MNTIKQAAYMESFKAYRGEMWLPVGKAPEGSAQEWEPGRSSEKLVLKVWLKVHLTKCTLNKEVPTAFRERTLL